MYSTECSHISKRVLCISKRVICTFDYVCSDMQMSVSYVRLDKFTQPRVFFFFRAFGWWCSYSQISALCSQVIIFVRSNAWWIISRYSNEHFDMSKWTVLYVQGTCVTKSDAERVFKTAVTRTFYLRRCSTVTEGDSLIHVVLEQSGNESTHWFRPDDWWNSNTTARSMGTLWRE